MFERKGSIGGGRIGVSGNKTDASPAQPTELPGVASGASSNAGKSGPPPSIPGGKKTLSDRGTKLVLTGADLNTYEGHHLTLIVERDEFGRVSIRGSGSNSYEYPGEKLMELINKKLNPDGDGLSLSQDIDRAQKTSEEQKKEQSHDDALLKSKTGKRGWWKL